MTTPHPPHRRGSHLFAGGIGGLALALAICAGLALAERPAAAVRRAEGLAVAAALGLTDLALFGEARYTRHPSQADLASAFQDGPGVLDPFPTGSLVAPPHDFGAGRFVVEEAAR
jgi:hypothetical protein